jgi:hypothetical protein
MIINYSNHLKLVASVKDHGSSATFQQCWKQTAFRVNNASIPDNIKNFQNYWGVWILSIVSDEHIASIFRVE